MIHALHGNLGTPSDWDSLELPGLVAHDLWSHLESKPGLNLEDWGAGFSRGVANDDPDPFLLGYSMGGRLALHALLAASEKWKGAVIVSAHPGLDDPEAHLTRLQRDRDWANQARTADWQTFLETWNAQPVFSQAPPSDSQWQLESRREAIARAFENWSLGHQRHLGERLSRCGVPILWITGERDERFTQLAAELVPTLPTAEHVVLSNCGHRIPFEGPAALAEVIQDFQSRRL